MEAVKKAQLSLATTG